MKGKKKKKQKYDRKNRVSEKAEGRKETWGFTSTETIKAY